MLSTAITWALFTGRFVGRRESDADALRDLKAALAVAVSDCKAAIAEKADCDRVSALERRMQGEHDERKRIIERINLDLGTIRTEQARHDERLKVVERHPS
ncbi:MAG TPA: hypothetical protein VEA16_08390 [Vicinamibacterales bacterium]|nr:hypothetical protein [Vicinamibacterales bacterium]